MGLKLGVPPVLEVRSGTDPAAVAAFIRAMEEAGVESIWAVEYVVAPERYDSSYPYGPSGRMSLLPGTDVPDPLHWLTFAAAHISWVLLGSAILILPEHHPVHLAKRLPTPDVLSGGRLLAGVGVGWLREEYRALGVPYEQRGARTDEYLAALRALWAGSPATFAGEYVRLDGVHCEPKPVRPGWVPTVVGGHSTAAVRRAARYGDGFYPLGVDMAGMADLLRRLAEACRAAGRDPAEVEVTARAPSRRAGVEALAELGVPRVVMRVPIDSPDAVTSTVDRYRREVLGQ